MKRFFYKSNILIIFSSAISFVLTFGISLMLEFQKTQKNDFNDKTMITGIIILVILLLLLNVTDVLSYWLRGKRTEIFVKNIIGISNKYIYIPLYVNLNLLILVSYLIGVFFSVIFAQIIASLLLVKINFISCFISLIFSLLIENCFCIAIIRYKLRHGFMELK